MKASISLAFLTIATAANAQNLIESSSFGYVAKFLSLGLFFFIVCAVVLTFYQVMYQTMIWYQVGQ